jgi:hypothetical protein
MTEGCGSCLVELFAEGAANSLAFQHRSNCVLADESSLEGRAHQPDAPYCLIVGLNSTYRVGDSANN